MNIIWDTYPASFVNRYFDILIFDELDKHQYPFELFKRKCVFYYEEASKIENPSLLKSGISEVLLNNIKKLEHTFNVFVIKLLISGGTDRMPDIEFKKFLSFKGMDYGKALHGKAVEIINNSPPLSLFDYNQSQLLFLKSHLFDEKSDLFKIPVEIIGNITKSSYVLVNELIDFDRFKSFCIS